MAAAPDLGSGAVRRGGSSPFIRTKKTVRSFIRATYGFFILHCPVIRIYLPCISNIPFRKNRAKNESL